MAIGDKKAVVMEADRAIANGIATLDENKNVPFDQLGNVTRLNLLDNWYFADPINQRGGYVVTPGTTWYMEAELKNVGGTIIGYETIVEKTSTYAKSAGGGYFAASDVIRGYTDAGYGIDRWKNDTTGIVLLKSDGIELIGSDNEFGFHQIIKNNLLNQTATFSIITDNDIFTITKGATTNLYDKITIIQDIGWISFRVNPDGTSSAFIQIYAGKRLKVKAVKLELGTYQTLAHQDANGNWVLTDLRPDKSIELIKCCMSKADDSDKYANNRKTPLNINAVPKTNGYLSNKLEDLDNAKIPGHYLWIDNSGTFGTSGFMYDLYVSCQKFGEADAITQTLTGAYVGGEKPKIFYRSYYFANNSSGWTPWLQLATTNYAVNKAGDTMTGDLSFNNRGGIGNSTNGTSWNATYLQTQNLSGNGFTRLALFGNDPETHANVFKQEFDGDGVLLNDAIFLDTGNKPSGSYTGNGDSTIRIIETGGIGSCLYLHSNAATAIVTKAGAFCATTIVEWVQNITFNNGTLSINTNDYRVNQNGTIYSYQIL